MGAEWRHFYFFALLSVSFPVPAAAGTKWSLSTEVTNGNEKSYEYFTKVIPTQYQRLSGPLVSAYRQSQLQ